MVGEFFLSNSKSRADRLSKIMTWAKRSKVGRKLAFFLVALTVISGHGNLYCDDQFRSDQQ